jgi:hypothetical protein
LTLLSRRLHIGTKAVQFLIQDFQACGIDGNSVEKFGVGRSRSFFAAAIPIRSSTRFRLPWNWSGIGRYNGKLQLKLADCRIGLGASFGMNHPVGCCRAAIIFIVVVLIVVVVAFGTPIVVSFLPFGPRLASEMGGELPFPLLGRSKDTFRSFRFVRGLSLNCLGVVLRIVRCSSTNHDTLALART